MFCQGTELKIDQLVLLSPQKNAIGIMCNMVHLVVLSESLVPEH